MQIKMYAPERVNAKKNGCSVLRHTNILPSSCSAVRRRFYMRSCYYQTGRHHMLYTGLGYIPSQPGNMDIV